MASPSNVTYQMKTELLIGTEKSPGLTWHMRMEQTVSFCQDTNTFTSVNSNYNISTVYHGLATTPRKRQGRNYLEQGGGGGGGG